MQQDIAETRALSLLTWLAADEELMLVFMGATGVSQSDLRQRAGDADFLASVVDFILMDDRWVLKAAHETGIAAQDFALIRAVLPGGGDPNWT